METKKTSYTPTPFTPIPDDLKADSAKRAFIIRAVKEYDSRKEQVNKLMIENMRLKDAHEELLRACKAALVTLGDDELYMQCKETYETIRKAVAKAEGK